jgi:hypothetical protein
MKRLLTIAAIFAVTLCVAAWSARPIFDFVVGWVACDTHFACGPAP